MRHLDYSLRESDAEIFCIGPYTSHFLKSKYGLDSKCPRKNFSTDGLLSELKLNDLKDKKICLIKGDDGIDTIAKIASEVNATVENIGARRLHTIIEKILDDISFTATDRGGEKIVINKDYINKNLDTLVKDTDLSKFIL